MHVVRNRAHVVEELGVHRPPLVGVPHRLADQLRAGGGHGVLERELLAVKTDEAQSFVPHAALVGGFGRAGKPPLVDPAAFGTVRVQIVGMQLEPAAGMQEAARDPSRGQPQQSPASLQGFFQYGSHRGALNHV